MQEILTKLDATFNEIQQSPVYQAEVA
ncbi:hypothetical protein EHW99_0509 [Erwinia amylovora]|uniref:Uncharacterized protein n=2 Tax=Erwinia amylovora TaxID=552 RepID=A0A831A655_ERWAM|nr:hypothetical protein EaACW_3127 [Erwinia amylovora ACW56400]QJQ53216.1 hypothetical protein EHX00_0509 [Erwinia amylovora]CBA23018.1 hypothetical protein predicted by Glimmer/Critica [Erwinia amylovora CFBP1430]CCO79965.1 hypothetical protein BN432_3192 [Erwinia amylovora Ea356]CCO83770.1 hypothetical protein BN433_3218 [Erwinia amylovora Ea266]CCO87532.1 hypothetical protein BN434_3168 [Erwinia amylovora CFBP 2585]CCO91325.1 hypothetical protein BN435_3178 [Erwinia amylovora 01SFR-BO]CCO